jgi:hypothetical protein
MNHVFHDDPTGLKRLGIPHKLHSCGTALFGPGGIALCAGVVGALGRCKQQIDVPDLVAQLIWSYVLKPFVDYLRTREVVRVGLRGYRTEVNRSDHGNAGRAGPAAAKASATEEVQRAQRMLPMAS